MNSRLGSALEPRECESFREPFLSLTTDTKIAKLAVIWLLTVAGIHAQEATPTEGTEQSVSITQAVYVPGERGA
jgi:hypothetical protein